MRQASESRRWARYEVWNMVLMTEQADRPLTPLFSPEQLLCKDSRGTRSTWVWERCRQGPCLPFGLNGDDWGVETLRLFASTSWLWIWLEGLCWYCERMNVTSARRGIGQARVNLHSRWTKLCFSAQGKLMVCSSYLMRHSKRCLCAFEWESPELSAPTRFVPVKLIITTTWCNVRQVETRSV